MRFGRKPRVVRRDSDVAGDLRLASRRLTGWTVTGYSGVDMPLLLVTAADEIDGLRRALAAMRSMALSGEPYSPQMRGVVDGALGLESS